MKDQMPISETVPRDVIEGNYFAFDFHIYTLMTAARIARSHGEYRTMQECASWARAANWQRRYVYQILRRSGGDLPRMLPPQRMEAQS